MLKYWEERVAANGGYENLYTLGMRGIHDSGMQGGGSPEEQIALLEKIFAEQRALLAKHVVPAGAAASQFSARTRKCLGSFAPG